MKSTFSKLIGCTELGGPLAIFEAARIARLAAKDYHGYMAMTNETNRLETFLTIRDLVSDKDYWELLASAWQMTECSFPNTHIWLELFRSTRPNRECLMTAGERDSLSDLPDKIEVYRGTNTTKDRGCSWTLSKETAEMFAVYANDFRRRFFGISPITKQQFVITGECKKADIIALLNDRNESEVVIDFSKVSNKRFAALASKEITQGASKKTGEGKA